MASCGVPSIDRPNGGHDVGIGAAAADVAAHPFSDFVVGKLDRRLFGDMRSYGAGVSGLYLFDHRHGGTDLPGRAISALERVVFDERLLHGMQFSAGWQS